MSEQMDGQRGGGFAAWMKEQVTVGNLLVIGAFVFALGTIQTRAEMKDAQHDAAIAALEDRLRGGEFMRADVAEQRFRAIQDSIVSLKDSIERGFARLERVVR